MTTAARESFKYRQARVIALLILGLFGLIYGVYRVGQVFDVFARRYTLYTFVPSVTGLRQGAAVTLAGQRVGQVDEVEFIPIDEKVGVHHVRLRLAIDERVRDQVRTNSLAFIRTQGLLGDRFVDIQPGTVDGRVLAPGEVLASETPMDLDQMMVAAAEALDEVTHLVGDLREVTGGLARGEGTAGRLLTDDQLYNRLTAATLQLTATLQTINRSDGTLGRLISDPALYERLTATLARIDALTGQVLEGEGTLGQLLHSDTLHRGMLGVVERADTALARIGGGLDGLITGDGTIQRLLTDPAMYDELLKAVVDLQILLLDIRENPRRYRPEVNIDLF
jgi:phospholipid/cholesterol/gamma-HCH transport system substrate-binding protein